MRVLLADDENKVRSALKLSLAQISALEIVGEASDAIHLLQDADHKQPDLLLLDWELPGLPPEHLLRLLWSQQPKLRIIALSSRPEAEKRALEAGVWRFISKNDPPEKVLAVIREAVYYPLDQGEIRLMTSSLSPQLPDDLSAPEL